MYWLNYIKLPESKYTILSIYVNSIVPVEKSTTFPMGLAADRITSLIKRFTLLSNILQAVTGLLEIILQWSSPDRLSGISFSCCNKIACAISLP